MQPNRIATYLLGAAGVAGAVIPTLADFDTTTIVGWVTGLAVIATAAGTFLRGWQAYEERVGAGLEELPEFAPGLLADEQESPELEREPGEFAGPPERTAPVPRRSA